jgi:GntR family transcriptional regulator
MEKAALIAEDLKRKIFLREIGENARLPKQVELCAMYHTSRVTIQKAMTILQEKGIIQSNKKQGTFVTGMIDEMSYYDSEVTEITGTAARFTDRHRDDLSSQVLSFYIRKPRNIEKLKLCLSDEAQVYDILRLRKMNGDPILLEHTMMPIDLIPNISNEILSDSIYHYIENVLGFKIGKAYRKISACKPNHYDMEFLDCTETDPVLEVEQVANLDDNKPFEYSKTRHRYDHGSFLVI